ncbi:hypothetical protein CUZ56_00538 [Saezia sanguinis]|uniref:MalT-like TPR region domain-containing protein n=1 Tax=Saezia sanguinis TaxID=1965230 RepID=A0A433SHB3_9BURK|nr:hypothetical protein [Saezia sanguinis]RUS68054.1 hypothetical protein CUZ56_00538 [Saezia sanguinis]
MDARQHFQKALFLLDQQNIEGGEAALNDVICQAKAEGDVVLLAQALVCLGDLLIQSSREKEALQHLRRVLTLGQEVEDFEERYDDVLNDELLRAKQLLQEGEKTGIK